ncbi:hypothetical protein ACTSKR_13400 [Chitinibacteraceae bacterium HSL-7]
MIQHVRWLAIVWLAACTFDQNNIQGRWEVDLEPMLAQARALGHSPREVETVRSLYVNSRINITADALVITVAGFDKQTVLHYQRLTDADGCAQIRIADHAGAYRLCRDGNALEVHHSGTPLTERYRKA